MNSSQKDPTILTPEEIELRNEHRAQRAKQAADARTDVPRMSLAAWESKMPNSLLERYLTAYREGDPQTLAELEQLRIADEEASRQELRREQAVNRHNAYVATRPEIYRTASYDDFEPRDRNHAKIRGWWMSGAKNLLIAGHPGRGKTHAGMAICNQVAAADREGGKLPVTVRAYTAARVRELLQPLGAHQQRDEVYAAALARDVRALAEADLVLLDDLTAEKMTDWLRSALHRIIDQRVSNNRRTIVTMNAPTQKLVGEHMTEQFGAPIVSRLRDDVVAVWLEGEDRRTGSTWDPFA